MLLFSTRSLSFLYLPPSPVWHSPLLHPTPDGPAWHYRVDAIFAAWVTRMSNKAAAANVALPVDTMHGVRTIRAYIAELASAVTEAESAATLATVDTLAQSPVILPSIEDEVRWMVGVGWVPKWVGWKEKESS